MGGFNSGNKVAKNLKSQEGISPDHKCEICKCGPADLNFPARWYKGVKKFGNSCNLCKYRGPADNKRGGYAIFRRKTNDKRRCDFIKKWNEMEWKL